MLLVRTLVFTILALGSVTVGIPCLLLFPVEQLLYAMESFRLIGMLPVALGAVFYLWCAWDFAFTGKGTPAPIDPPKVLVLRGLYRSVRNPMYLGITLILVGEAIVCESLPLLAYAILVWSLFHLFVVYYEEPALKRRFGAACEAYRRAVLRWIPRVVRARKAGDAYPS